MQKEVSRIPWEKEGILQGREPPGYPGRERESCWEERPPGYAGRRYTLSYRPCTHGGHTIPLYIPWYTLPGTPLRPPSLKATLRTTAGERAYRA